MGCTSSKEAVSDIQGRRRSSIPTDKDTVEGRIEACSEFSSCRAGGAVVRYAYLSQRGYYPDELDKANQDAFSVTHGIGGVENDSFFGVYDGHGREGDLCAKFVKRELPVHLNRIVERARSKAANSHSILGKAAAASGSIRGSKNELKSEAIQRAIHCTHVRCNAELHANEDVDDKLSGTTAISVYFHGPGARITVANVGDSRAVMGQLRKNAYRALPLSRDQTPYRADERMRVIKAGARVLSLDQIEGLEPITDWDNEVELGEEIDEWGDPPRVWSPDGEYPGTAFTRSLGDLVAEQLGVYAEPEMITKELSPEDKILVIASDGVFEFLTNQSVIDICAKFQSPLEACRAIVAEAYELWLQYELRTDDITIICIFVDDLVDVVHTHTQPEGSSRRGWANSLIGDKAMNENSDRLDHNQDLHEDGNKPVRTGVDAMIKQLQVKNRVDYDEVNIADLVVEKTPEERQRISEVIVGNSTFQNISPQQKEQLYDVMEKMEVKKGKFVITQGTIGDYFYIVDNGKFEVRVLPDGADMPLRPAENPEDWGNVVHEYCPAGSAHPSFGEIALLHSIPRAASVVAQTDGVLWALHRAVFKKIILERSDRSNYQKAMRRKVDALKVLERTEIEILANKAEEVLFQGGDVIVKKGDAADAFYFVVHGKCVQKEDGKELNENEFFGDEYLSTEGNYDYTIEASGTTKCFKLSFAACTDEYDLGEKSMMYEQRKSSRNLILNKS